MNVQLRERPEPAASVAIKTAIAVFAVTEDAASGRSRTWMFMASSPQLRGMISFENRCSLFGIMRDSQPAVSRERILDHNLAHEIVR